MNTLGFHLAHVDLVSPRGHLYYAVHIDQSSAGNTGTPLGLGHLRQCVPQLFTSGIQFIFFCLICGCYFCFLFGFEVPQLLRST